MLTDESFQHVVKIPGCPWMPFSFPKDRFDGLPFMLQGTSQLIRVDGLFKSGLL